MACNVFVVLGVSLALLLAVLFCIRAVSRSKQAGEKKTG